MIDFEGSLDVVEDAMDRLRNQPVPDGPSTHLIHATARQLYRAENEMRCCDAKKKHATSRIARYAGVGSVALASVALVWFALLDRTAAVVFAEVKSQVERMQSVQYLEVVNHDGKFDSARRQMVLGRFLFRTEYLAEDGTIERVNIQDIKNGKNVFIIPKQKKFVVVDRHVDVDLDGGNPAERTVSPVPAGDFYTSIRHLPNEPTKRLGSKTLAGRKVSGFYFETTEGDSTWASTYWIDAETRLPVRVERSHQNSHPRIGRSDEVLTEFVFDDKLDASLFSTEAPAGYSATTAKSFGIRLP